MSPTVSRRYVRCVANRIARVRVGPCWKKRSGTINKSDGTDELNMSCNFKWLSNVCFLATEHAESIFLSGNAGIRDFGAARGVGDAECLRELALDDF